MLPIKKEDNALPAATVASGRKGNNQEHCVTFLSELQKEIFCQLCQRHTPDKEDYQHVL
jgi:hypothetical protein